MLNILVIEDDADARFLVAGILRTVGHTVREAEHGKRALEILSIERWLPHVILLDVAMPVMDGLTFLRKRKKLDELSAIPVIIVSATARGPIEDACCLLSKPVDPEVLLDAVQQFAS
jgi:CheY-like chemotaxis protein